MEAEVPHSALVTNLLKESKSKSGKSLFDHLHELISQLPMLNADLNNFEHFETLSDFLKKNSFSFKEPLTEQKIVELIKADLSTKNEWVLNSKQLEGECAKIGPQPNTLISNFMADSQLLEQAGIAFDKITTYQLNQSIRKLSHANQCSSIRFWGKIMCRNDDYFVAQGVSTKKNNTVISPGMEKLGEGVNQYTFWVTHNYLEQWEELPLITAQQMQAARMIKYICTGDLNAPVKAYPKFEGTEKHFLKAQLARITHTCQIVPNGLYAAGENDSIDFAEQFKFPDFGELATLDKWVHLNPYVLGQGRCTYYVDESLTQEAKQQQLTEFNQKDPKQDRLKAISEDKGPAQGEPNWLTRVLGDTQVFNGVGKQQGTSSCYAITTLKNHSWPGWLTVANSKTYTSIYIGYGLKTQQPLFQPFGPSDLLEQAEDGDEFPEPNPANPPDQIEPDSDDENKKEETV